MKILWENSKAEGQDWDGLTDALGDLFLRGQIMNTDWAGVMWDGAEWFGEEFIGAKLDQLRKAAARGSDLPLDWVLDVERWFNARDDVRPGDVVTEPLNEG